MILAGWVVRLSKPGGNNRGQSSTSTGLLLVLWLVGGGWTCNLFAGQGGQGQVSTGQGQCS